MLSSISTKFKIYFMLWISIMLMFVFIILMIGDGTIGLIGYIFNYSNGKFLAELFMK